MIIYYKILLCLRTALFADIVVGDLCRFLNATTRWATVHITGAPHKGGLVMLLIANRWHNVAHIRIITFHDHINLENEIYISEYPAEEHIIANTSGEGSDVGIDTVKKVYGSLENIKIVTLAPELDKGFEVTQALTAMGITVSVGHSMANVEDGEKAVESGATLITHLFNAMLPFHHRDPGLVGLLASPNIPSNKTVYYGIIADGIHTHPAALQIAYRTHPAGLILVTDAISAMGLEEGTHHIGQMAIEVREKRAYISGTNTLCGSIATMSECVQLFLKNSGCSLEYALEAASLHPALAIGIEQQKGTLNFGSDADFVMLSDNLDVSSTWIAGECVYP